MKAGEIEMETPEFSMNSLVMEIFLSDRLISEILADAIKRSRLFPADV
jgi:hypothetical protein